LRTLRVCFRTQILLGADMAGVVHVCVDLGREGEGGEDSAILKCSRVGTTAAVSIISVGSKWRMQALPGGPGQKWCRISCRGSGVLQTCRLEILFHSFIRIQ